jgi:hypothetical protein
MDPAYSIPGGSLEEVMSITPTSQKQFKKAHVPINMLLSGAPVMA